MLEGISVLDFHRIYNLSPPSAVQHPPSVQHNNNNSLLPNDCDTRCRISVVQEDKLGYADTVRSEGAVILLGRTRITALKTKETVFTQNIKPSSP